MPFPAFDELAGVLDRDPLLRGELGVEDRPAEEPADAERLDGSGDRVLEVVEVEERGRAGKEHLRDAGSGSRFHVRLGPAGIHGEEGLEEPGELPVVGDPSEEAHRDVGMGVDETGNDREIPTVDDGRSFAGRSRTDMGESSPVHAEVSAEDAS